MRTRCIAVAMLFTLSSAGELRASEYGMADLDALQKQGAWQELVDHAEDVPPSQRNAHWSQLVEEAATGVLAALYVDKVSISALGTADALTRRFPTLKKSKSFMAKRADVGVRAFTRCFELVKDDTDDATACADRLVGFSDGDPDNADLAQRALALIGQHLHYSTASPFPIYYRSIGGKKGAKDCKNASAKSAVIAALSLDKTDARVAEAREVASQTCWDQMKDELVDAVGNPQVGAHYFENACGFLVDKKALGTLQTNRCKALPK